MCRNILQETVQQQFPANATRISLLHSSADFCRKRQRSGTLFGTNYFSLVSSIENDLFSMFMQFWRTTWGHLEEHSGWTRQKPNNFCAWKVLSQASGNCLSMTSSLKCFSEPPVWLTPLLSLGSTSSIFNAITTKGCVDQGISRCHYFIDIWRSTPLVLLLQWKLQCDGWLLHFMILLWI